MDRLKESRKFYLNITELKIALTIEGIVFEECRDMLPQGGATVPALHINGTTYRLKFRHINGSILNKNFRGLFHKILADSIMRG